MKPRSPHVGHWFSLHVSFKYRKHKAALKHPQFSFSKIRLSPSSSSLCSHSGFILAIILAVDVAVVLYDKCRQEPNGKHTGISFHYYDKQWHWEGSDVRCLLCNSQRPPATTCNALLFLSCRLSYRTGQDTANCDTCRNSACIIYRYVNLLLPLFYYE